MVVPISGNFMTVPGLGTAEINWLYMIFTSKWGGERIIAKCEAIDT